MQKTIKNITFPLLVSTLFSLLILFWAVVCPAQQNLFTLDSKTEKAPWDIEAQELSYDKDTEIYTAEGEVVIKRGDRVLKADYATLDRKNMIAVARGHVHYTAAGDEMRGEQLTIDLIKQNGELEKGRLFLKQNNYHVTGGKIWKTGESTYRVMEGTITSCDGDDPSWTITAKEFDVTLEGYGELRQASFKARSIPILYTPYLIFPAKTKRQTGLLMPEPGYSNTNGFLLNLPFFWAINDSMDATFYQNILTRRGYMQGGEFRYMATPTSKGAIMADYLFKDLAAEEEFKQKNISEPYADRYWVRGKADQDLPKGFLLKMDLDWVSDRDYLKEFRGIGNGKDRNRVYFLSEFGRDLDDETVMDRRNAAIFSRAFNNYNFIGGIQYYQEVDNTDDALNQLPYARFDGLRYEIYKNFFFQWYSNYNYYYRKKLDYGQTMDLNPGLSYPYRFKTYLNTEPTVGLYQTFYQVSNKTDQQVADVASRTIPNFKLDLSTDIQRIFDMNQEKLKKIKHNIRPQIIYDYVPDVAQQPLPSFVPLINPTNTITYNLTNTFTAKSLIGKGKEDEDLHSYLDFFFFKLYQVYDINEATRDEKSPRYVYTPTTTGTTTGNGTIGVIGTPGPRQPFSDLFGELEFFPSPFLRLRSTVGWGPYTNQINTQTHTLYISTPGGSWINLEYLTASGEAFRQLNSSLYWKIAPAWTADFLNRWSIDQNQNYETTFGFTYTHQCWGIKAHYTDTPDDKKVLVSISLKGLGEF